MEWEAPPPVTGPTPRGRAASSSGLRSLVPRFDKHDIYCSSPFPEAAGSAVRRETPPRARSRS
eukprot:14152054-Heterocapsa_arctica.AAC.1